MKILLVDDDPAIVLSLEAMLRRLPGHEVRNATTGGGALQAAMAMGGVARVGQLMLLQPFVIVALSVPGRLLVSS